MCHTETTDPGYAAPDEKIEKFLPTLWQIVHALLGALPVRDAISSPT